MSSFPEVCKILSPSKVGCAELTHYEISKMDAMIASMHGQYTEARKVAVLKVNGDTVMSDSNYEHRTNREAVRLANGKVLIAGLGLGMILHPILDKPNVDSVLVVEKYQDVIDIVSPTIKSPKLQIVCADIFEWKPPKGEKYDAIYFDIWNDVCTDSLSEINTLHRRFKNYKAEGGWMSSWCVGELRSRKRRGC